MTVTSLLPYYIYKTHLYVYIFFELKKKIGFIYLAQQKPPSNFCLAGIFLETNQDYLGIQAWPHSKANTCKISWITIHFTDAQSLTKEYCISS